MKTLKRFFSILLSAVGFVVIPVVSIISIVVFAINSLVTGNEFLTLLVSQIPDLLGMVIALTVAVAILDVVYLAFDAILLRRAIGNSEHLNKTSSLKKNPYNLENEDSLNPIINSDEK